MIARDVPALRAVVQGWRRNGLNYALVPTMGALHGGHLELVRVAARACRKVIVSIFVNPLQFGAGEDFEGYPRNEGTDVAAAAGAGAEVVFVPTAAAMYAPDHATTVHVAGLSEGLCGRRRPGHFDGVATVVSKLLLQALPDTAVFGEKDYQQLMIVRRLVRDLDIPVRIEGVPTVREADGLAMSSRNVYLSAAERRIAPALAGTLRGMGRVLAGEAGAVGRVVAEGLARLSAAGFETIDYLEVCDAETLAPLAAVDRPARVLVAAWLGRTRLIDNVPVAPGEPP